MVFLLYVKFARLGDYKSFYSLIVVVPTHEHNLIRILFACRDYRERQREIGSTKKYRFVAGGGRKLKLILKKKLPTMCCVVVVFKPKNESSSNVCCFHSQPTMKKEKKNK